MSRHSGGSTDSAYGDGTWLPGGHGSEAAEDDVSGTLPPAERGSGAHRRPPSPTQTSSGSEAQTGPPWGEVAPPWGEVAPPWEQPGWDGTSIPAPGADPAALAGKHPSDPLPSLPLQEGDWPESEPVLGYPGDDAPEPRYPDDGPEPSYGAEPGYLGDDGSAGGYDGVRDDDTGYGYAGYTGAEYDPDGYQEAGYRPGYEDAGGFTDTGTGFTDTGTGFTDTGTGFTGTGTGTGTGFTDTGTGFASAGEGYGHPDFGGDPYPADPGRYPGDGGYPAGDDGPYQEYGEVTAGSGGWAGDPGYRDREDWYTGEQPGWAQDDDSGLLPGMSTGRGSGEDGPGARPAGRGGRSGEAGPGKKSSGRARPGKAGTGRAATSRSQGGQPPGGKRKSRMRRLAPWLALSVVLALLIGAGGGYFYVYRTYLHPPDFSGQGTGSVVVHIFPGDTASVVGQRLQRQGVVASARAFSNAAKVSGQGTALEPGAYRVHLHMSAALAFALLLKPSSRMQTKITIPEGWRLSQIIAELGRATDDPQGYQQAIKDTGALDLPPFAGGKPEGYLFPATYDVQPKTPPIKVLQAMVTRFGQEAASVSLPAAAAHAELTQAQVIIVASLIQAEGRQTADFPKIARVIYNRLNANPQIPLQLDSTVMYALHRYGIIATSAQIKVKSPYNTYLHTGLPPGPIDSPGDAAIKAALHPAHGPWMYFVTVDPKTGLTKFTSSFSQFEQFRAQLMANIAKGK